MITPSLASATSPRVIWIRCHPLSFEAIHQSLQVSISKVLDEASKKGHTEEVELSDLRDELISFDIFGPRSNQVIAGALKLVKDSLGDQQNVFGRLGGLRSSGSVPQGMVIGLKVHDPRLRCVDGYRYLDLLLIPYILAFHLPMRSHMTGLLHKIPRLSIFLRHQLQHKVNYGMKNLVNNFRNLRSRRRILMQGEARYATNPISLHPFLLTWAKDTCPRRISSPNPKGRSNPSPADSTFGFTCNQFPKQEQFAATSWLDHHTACRLGHAFL